MKKKRILSLILTFVLVICMMPTPPASAVTMTGGEVLYLKPNNNWKSDGARFAVYFFNNSTGKNTWVSMTKINDDLYKVTVPSGTWANLIFCRMNPSAAANNWNNKWNQSSDLTYNGSKNLYTVSEGAWDKGSGTWSELKTTYTVAGTAGLCGTAWNTTDTANDMTLENGVYVKTYTGIAAGTHQFKIVLGHSWDYASWPAQDKTVTLAEKSNVTITFNPANGTISVSTSKWLCPHTNKTTTTTEPTCVKPGATVVTCKDCGEQVSSTPIPATGVHTYNQSGICSGCGAVKPVAAIDQTVFGTLDAALAAAKENDKITLLDHASADAVILLQGIDLELNGFTMTVNRLTAYPGSTVTDKTEKGLLNVAKDRLMLQQDNGALPIWNGEGYVLRTCKNLHTAEGTAQEGTYYIYQFLAAIGTDSYGLLAQGAEASGVTMKVVVSWQRADETLGSSAFTYGDGLLRDFYQSYNPETQTFEKAFQLTLKGVADKEGLTFQVFFESDTGVVLECKAADAQ